MTKDLLQTNINIKYIMDLFLIASYAFVFRLEMEKIKHCLKQFYSRAAKLFLNLYQIYPTSCCSQHMISLLLYI